MKKISDSKAVTVIAAVLVAVFFYLAIHYAQTAASAKQQRKTGQIVAKVRQQNAVLKQQQADIESECRSDLRTYNAFQKIITAATKPPSRAGTTLTPEQIAALASYKTVLTDAVGPKVDWIGHCPPEALVP